MSGKPVPALALPPFQFCIPPNPAVGVLRNHAELGLRKLRSGRNIAGIRREVPAYAAPTDTATGMPVVVNGQVNLSTTRSVPPTAYRYAVLIARAKELVQQAAQIEAQYLGAIERRDDAAYGRQKARQEMTLATAQVRLQSLRVAEANDGVKLAEIQTQRALIQQQTYEMWINRGLNEYEQLMLESYSAAAEAKSSATIESAIAQGAQAAVSAAAAGVGAGAAAAAALVVASSAIAGARSARVLAWTERDIAVASLQASHEHRRDEWMLLSAVAAQDLQIGVQEVNLAKDRVGIVEQERSIAETQETQARDTLEFLANRFTKVELFDWMSGVLSYAYRALLQQAAAMLNVAWSQLAFERQEAPPVVVRADYWAAPSSDPLALGSGTGDDRRGLTGSARLLADLYQLDQYAFDTERRKLAVSKTFSLAQLAPAEFQAFRETGVLVFATPTELFDRDFPGHYLRLIRRVRTSFIALIPPVEGVRATLSSTGISRVVVGPEPFQAVTIRREPESIALSLPIGGTGVFEGDASGEMYLPFEGNGVDATWELRLPRAANRFDYHSLSDVLISFDYLALNNYDYGRAVIQRLNPVVRADRAFSLRNDFPDAWYDLHNPELLEAGDRLILRLRIAREDFSTNLDRVRLEHIALRLSGPESGLQSFMVSDVRRTDPGGQVFAAAAGARAIDGSISTRRGNGSPWQPLLAAGAGGARPTPFGAWEINLRSTDPADAAALQDALRDGRLEDILLVLSHAADLPPWPD